MLLVLFQTNNFRKVIPYCLFSRIDLALKTHEGRYTIQLEIKPKRIKQSVCHYYHYKWKFSSTWPCFPYPFFSPSSSHTENISGNRRNILYRHWVWIFLSDVARWQSNGQERQVNFHPSWKTGKVQTCVGNYRFSTQPQSWMACKTCWLSVDHVQMLKQKFLYFIHVFIDWFLYCNLNSIYYNCLLLSGQFEGENVLATCYIGFVVS